MDCGTTNMKAVILADHGSVVAKASRPNVTLAPFAGAQEQDADQWWKDAVSIFRELSEKAGKEVIDQLKGISISSHTVSLLPVDAFGKPLRNAILYSDIRSAEELKEIVHKVGRNRFVSLVGGQPSAAFLPNKILWFRRQEPELFDRTAYFLQASSYLNYRLTGVFSSDLDQAIRTQCLDVSKGQWSSEIGEAIGVDLEKRLPPLYQMNDIIGNVTKEAEAVTGLKAGIPVIAGCSDAMASMYAAGMSRLGDAVESSGTSSLFFAGSMTKSSLDVPVVTRPCAIHGMPWVFDAPVTTTGAALNWFITRFALEERQEAQRQGKDIYSYLNELALDAGPGSGGLYFFPYLLGERAPLWNDYAKGMFIGLDMHTKRHDLVRSVFEGTSYALRHVMETVRASGARVDVLRICGGGARSAAWNQIKASVLNVPVYVLDEEAGDVPVGDALIVGHKVGVFSDLTEIAEKTARIKEVILPDPKWVKVYDKLYPYYVRMYRHLDGDLMEIKKAWSDCSSL